MQEEQQIPQKLQVEQCINSTSQQVQIELQEFMQLLQQKSYSLNTQQKTYHQHYQNCVKHNGNQQNIEKHLSFQYPQDQNNLNLFKKYVRNCKSFKQLISMKHFCLRNQKKLDSKQLIKFTKFLQNLQTLTLINCSGVFWPLLENFQKLAKIYFADTSLFKLIIKDLPNLEQITIKQCNPLKELSIVSCPKLQTLLLVKIKIINLSLQQLASLSQFKIKGKCQIQNLKLYKCDSIQKIFQVLCLTRSSLKTLQINSLNKLSGDLGEEIKLSSQLKNLILKNCSQIQLLTAIPSRIVQIQLHNLQKLKMVQIYGRHYLQKLIFAQCNGMKQIQILQSSISDQFMETLIKNIPKKLQNLTINVNRGFQKFILEKHDCLKNLKVNFTRVRQVEISNIPLLQTLALSPNSQLKSISIKNCNKLKRALISFQDINKQKVTFKKLNFQIYFSQQIVEKNNLYFDFTQNLKGFIIESAFLTRKHINQANLKQVQELIILKSYMLKTKDKIQLTQIKSKMIEEAQQQRNMALENQNQTGQFILLNLLTQISTLNLFNLNMLQLKYCKINNIQSISFLNISQLKSINLSYNEIWSIKPLYKTNQYGNVLSMYENPFKYIRFKKVNSVICTIFMPDQLTEFQMKNILKIQSRNYFKFKIKKRKTSKMKLNEAGKGIQKQ